MSKLKVDNLPVMKDVETEEGMETTGGAVFAKYDGVDGESVDAQTAELKLGTDGSKTKDANHDKWIDVLSIDWGSHKPGGGA